MRAVGLQPLQLVFTFLLPLAFCAQLLAADEKAKLPVPADGLIAKTEIQLRDLYKPEYTKSPAERHSFAKELLAQAHNINSDAATRFVFYREARNVAASTADITTA